MDKIYAVQTREDGRRYGIAVCIEDIASDRAVVVHRLREARQAMKHIGLLLPT